MHTPLLRSRWSRWLGVAALGLFAAPHAQAQLSGPKAIPGDYPSVAAAITDLNTQGVGAGGVTFNIAAGHTETFASPTAGAITATGTAANPITFQKAAGSGANPLITAGVGTTLNLDAIISLSGSDYVTLDGLELAESAANTTPTTQMEFGIALFRPSPTDGAQFNTIRNCVVTLNKTNTATFGIYGAASTAALATSVAATSPAGANSGNKVNGNIVTNAASGMYFTASTLTTIANQDLNNEVGVTAGNQVYNFGTTATGWGIGGNYQNGFKVVNNVVNNTLNYAGGTTVPVAASTVTSTLRGIYGNTSPSANIDITGNTITLASGTAASLMSGIDNGIGSTAAGNTVNITGNTVQMSSATVTTSTLNGIVNSATAATVNLNGNTVQNVAMPAATTAAFNGISNAGSVPTLNMNNNTVTNNTVPGSGTMVLLNGGGSTTANVNASGNTLTGNAKSGTTATGGIMYCFQTLNGAITFANNIVTNNGTVASGTSSATLWGYYNFSSATSETLTGNTITGLSISGTSTSTGHTLGGVRSFTGTTDLVTFAQNVIGNLAISGTGSGIVSGIHVSSSIATGNTITRNKIYGLSAVGAAGVVNGVHVAGGGTYTVANNLIGELSTPAATGLLAINGIQVSGGAASNVYFNTIYLNATSSGATFGTSGIYLNSTTTSLDARNNIVVNKSTAAGTGGYTVALRRGTGTAGATPSNLAAATNNNLYFAGTPSATNLIYVEGSATATNAQQTLAAYKAFLGNREQNSVTEDVPFLSTTGSAATFLHISPGTPTQVESAGQPISSITTDFDGETRNATTPDIGADEGTFLPLDLTGPGITYTALASTASTANRTLTATIVDNSGVATGTNAPRLYFRKGSTGAFVFVNATSVSGSAYTFTFDYALVGGVTQSDVIQYYVAAQDLAASPNASTNPFGGGGVNPPGTTPPSLPNQYTILTGLSGTYYVGTSTSPDPTRTYATLTAAASAYSSSGLTGAVTFLLLDATYTAATGEAFPVAFFANGDASAANTLTIRPNTGVSSTVTAAGSVLALASTRYITIDGSNTVGGSTRNLTLNNTALTASSYALGLLGQTGQAQNNQFTTIRNVNLTGGGATTNATFGILLSGPDNDNVTLQNNNILGVTVGIQGFGTALASAGGLDNLVVTGNLVGPATATTGQNINNTGILLSNLIAPTVTNNTVQNVTSAGTILGLQVQNATNATVTGNSVLNVASTGAAATGMGVFNTSTGAVSQNLVQGLSGNSGSAASFGLILGSGNNNLVVDRNRLLGLTEVNTAGNGVKGLEVQVGIANANVRISNNFVQVTAASGYSGTFSNTGIRLNGTQSGIRLYHNSVNMTGTDVFNIASISAALNVASGSTGLDIRNNIFRNSIVNSGNAGAKAYAFYSTAPASAFTTLNYNDYFVSGTQGVLAFFNSADVTTLAALRTATGQDANSLNVDPAFVSTTDLHVTATALNGAATPIASVTTDIDGETRNATTPDIGADEFMTNLDIAATALVSPVAANQCFTNAETVTVSITNANATTALNFANNPVTVTVTITRTGTTPVVLTQLVNTGTLAAGASQNVTFATTADFSAVGSYSVAVSTTLQGDENANNNNLAPVTITTAPARSADFTLPATTLCAGAGTTLTPTLGTGATAGTFSVSPATGLVVDPATGVVSAANSTAGTYVITNTLAAGNGCAAVTATQTVTVAPQTTATFSYSGASFCQTGTTNPTPTITGTPGGTFSATPSGLTLDAATGVITLSSSTPGAYTVTYAVSGTCPSSTTQSVTITAPQSAAFSYPAGSNCAGSTGTVTAALGGGAVAGTFTASPAGLSINPATGAVSLSASAAGTYTVTNTLAAANGCAQVSSTAGITLNATPSTAFAYAGGTFCQTGTNPTPTITGQAGGNFSATPTGLSIDPATGAINLAASSIGTYTVTYAVPGTCAASSSTTVTISTAPSAAFAFAAGSNCAGSAGTLSPSFGTGSSAGSFTATPTGLSIDPSTGVVTLGTSTAGTYTITNSIAASGGCAAATATQTLTLNAAPVATLTAGGPTTFCDGGNVVLTAPAGTGNTYQFFNGATSLGAASATNTLTVTAGGSYTVVVTNTATCQATSVATTVTVNPRTTATFSYTGSPFCRSNATNPAPTVTGTAGGTFSSTTGLVINAATGVVDLAASAPGTYVITYSVSGACASTSTQSITITAPAVATFSYGTGTTFCVSGTTNPAVVLAPGAMAGTFSVSPATGLTIDATTGAITLSSSAAGTYTVTNTVAAAGGCASISASTTVTITAAPIAAFSYGTGTTFCVSGAANPAVVLGTGATAGTFTSTTGLTLNATTGAITLSSSTPGTYTVTNTIAAANGCATATATATVTITAAPVAAFSYGTGSTFCVTGTANPAVTLGTGATAGTFSSTTGLTLNASTGAITLSSSTPGTYTVTNTIAAANGCSTATATTTVTITAAPTAAFSYASTGNCAGSATPVTPTLATGATAGTFSSTTGLTLNATTGAVNLATSTAGTYTVTNTVAPANGCAAATATATITVNPAAIANAGPAQAFCSGASAQLGVAAVAGTTYAYTPAAGLSNANVANPTVTLTNTTGAPITTTYTLTATTAQGCTATSTVTVTVNPRPAAPTLSAAYNGTTTTLTSSAATGNQFFLNGVAISGATGQTYVINGAPAQLGSYTVVVTNAQGCASLPSSPLVVTKARNSIAGTTLRVYPNPTPTGQVTLELTGFRLATQLVVLDALGRVVASEVLPATVGTAIHSLDLKGVATGVYMLRLSNADGVETRRLVRE